MTIKELINILSKYDENLDIMVEYYNEDSYLTKCLIQEDDIHLDNKCIVIDC